MVVAQLVEWSLLTLVKSSHPQNLYIKHLFYCIEKTKIKKKRPSKAHFIKRHQKRSVCKFCVSMKRIIYHFDAFRIQLNVFVRDAVSFFFALL